MTHDKAFAVRASELLGTAAATLTLELDIEPEPAVLALIDAAENLMAGLTAPPQPGSVAWEIAHLDDPKT